MEWLSLDTKIHMGDSVFRRLMAEDEGAYCRFEMLCCLAKDAADMDPDRWQGHIVTPAGIPLTAEDMSLLYAFSGRNRVTKMRQALAKLELYGLITRCEEHQCWLIVDWLRWWKKSDKSNNERQKRYRDRLRQAQSFPPRQEEVTRYVTPPVTALPYNTIPNSTPPIVPQGTREDDPYGSINPEDVPRERQPADQFASTDKSRLAGNISPEHWDKLNALCLQSLTRVSPTGINTAARRKLDNLLASMPPPGWRFNGKPGTPRNWASQLVAWVKAGVEETQAAMDARKDHGIKWPADWACVLAGNACAEVQAAHRTEEAKRG